jgi:hypothetical protein
MPKRDMSFKNTVNTIVLYVCYLRVSMELPLELHIETLWLSIREAVMYHRNIKIIIFIYSLVFNKHGKD